MCNRPRTEITNMTANFYISLLIPLNNQKEIFGSMRNKEELHHSDKETVTVNVEINGINSTGKVLPSDN